MRKGKAVIAVTRAEWLRETLADKFGINSKAELDEAILKMEKLDIGVFVNRKPKADTKREGSSLCAS